MSSVRLNLAGLATIWGGRAEPQHQHHHQQQQQQEQQPQQVDEPEHQATFVNGELTGDDHADVGIDVGYISKFECGTAIGHCVSVNCRFIQRTTAKPLMSCER